MPMVVDHQVDARDSACPGPLLELIRGIRAARVGETVAVLSTDPASTTDIPDWVATSGHELMAREQLAGHVRYVVKKVR